MALFIWIAGCTATDEATSTDGPAATDAATASDAPDATSKDTDTATSTDAATNPPGELFISEFMAINDSVLVDEDGDFSDWIEIHNPGAEPVNLDGWFLTDNPFNHSKWPFPPITLNPDAYLVVFASDKDRAPLSGYLHTNFALAGSGDFLALVAPGGLSASSFGDSYPYQHKDVSYGLFNGQFIYMDVPTPGSANVAGTYVSAPTFSHERGFYSAPFDVALSAANCDCDVYYTTDGSRPDATGTLYTSPITVDATTVLSAIAIDRASSTMSDIVTQTYLFVDSILEQTDHPDGYPSVWGSDYPADYEMDPDICTAENAGALEAALKSLPTVSLVTNIDYLFSASDDVDTGGIYTHTTETSEEWERPVSMEYFDLEENLFFQVNCGLRLHGGNSRNPDNSPKHSFRVSFRSDYGPSRLSSHLFEQTTAANTFNSLVLRAGYNYSWVKNSPEQCEGADYVRDAFTKRTQLAMGHPAAHTKFVHLYLNGLYWGVYDISEKITNDFAESYLGGNEDDYDVVKDHNGVTDGDRVAWEALVAAASEGFETASDYQRAQGRNADGTVNALFQNLLDVVNLADYMIINFYIGNGDWDGNNWLAIRNRVTNEHGFKFFCWDAETSMIDLGDNIVDTKNPGNPSGIFAQLMKNSEFRLLFAERVRHHFSDGGALTPAKTEARYMKLADALNNALLAESARWGDYRRDVDPDEFSYELYTHDKHWLARLSYMQNTYLPQRSDVVLDQLTAAGLYP